MGAAYGHMQYMHEDDDLRFSELRRIRKDLQRGKFKKYDVVEKTDGQNLMVTWKSGKIYIARNKSQLQKPLTQKEFSGFIPTFPLVQLVFNHAITQLKNTFNEAEDRGVDLDSYFHNGRSFLNLEVVHRTNYNVINYSKSFLQFHSFITYNDNIKSFIENEAVARLLASLFTTFRWMGEFEIIGYKSLELMNKTFEYCDDIEAYLRTYNLKLSNTIGDYLRKCWEEYLMENMLMFGYAPDKDYEIKEVLVQRWCFNKKIKPLPQIKKMCNDETYQWIKKIDKTYKEIHHSFIKWLIQENMYFGYFLFNYMDGFITGDPFLTQQEIEDKISYVITKTKNDKIKKVKTQACLSQFNGFENPITEGIAFKYKNKKYKLTGVFPYVSELLGIVRYDR